jgi:hypothetical protein
MSKTPRTNTIICANHKIGNHGVVSAKGWLGGSESKLGMAGNTLPALSDLCATAWFLKCHILGTFY